jgi:hypothetical protein
MDLTVQQHMQTAVIAIRENRAQDAIALLTTIIVEAESSTTTDVEMFARGLRAPTFAASGEREAALADGRRALSLAKTLGDKDSIAHYAAFLRELGDVVSTDVQTAADTVDADEEQITPRTDPLQAASEFLMAGDSARAVQILEPLVVFAEGAKSVVVEASAAGMLAQALMLEGDLVRAREFATRARNLAATQDDDDSTAHFESLRATLEEDHASESASDRAQTAAMVHAAVHRAGAQLSSGNAKVALQTLYPVLSAVCEHGLKGAEATLRGLTAQALLQLGRSTDAASEATKALKIAQQLGDDEAVTGFRQLLEYAFGLIPERVKA